MGVDNMNVAANSSVLASKSLETCFAFKDVMASHSLHSNNWGKNVKNCKQGLKGQRCLHIICSSHLPRHFAQPCSYYKSTVEYDWQN